MRRTPRGPPGQRLPFWMGLAAREAREEAGVSREQIAVKLGGVREVLDRFERGQSLPRDLERVLAAYAECADLKDPRDIVVQAMRLWFKDGEPPTLNSDSP